MANSTLIPVSLSVRSLQESIVSGCDDRDLVGQYAEAMVFEARVKGLLSGIALGALGGVALLVYLRMKGKGASE